MKRTASSLAMVVLVLAAAAPVNAQESGPQRTENAFQFRLGGFFPAGGGQLWNNNEQVFTLDHSDFNDGVLGFSYVTGINNHFEIGFNVDFYDATVGSLDRGIAEAPDLHPAHDTNLQMTPVSVDFRFLPGGRYGYRGRQGQYRVHRPVPYVGAGVGINYWRYRESGYFVFEDTSLPPDDPDRFFADFDDTKDSGTALEAHVLAGLELPMGPSWSLVFEGRYSWSNGDVGNSYLSASELTRQDLKLDGASTFLGASFHF